MCISRLYFWHVLSALVGSRVWTVGTPVSQRSSLPWGEGCTAATHMAAAS